MSRLCEEDKNTEAQRTQSFPSCFSSVISVPPCFKSSHAEIAIHGYIMPSPRDYAHARSLYWSRRGGRRRRRIQVKANEA